MFSKHEILQLKIFHLRASLGSKGDPEIYNPQGKGVYKGLNIYNLTRNFVTDSKNPREGKTYLVIVYTINAYFNDIARKKHLQGSFAGFLKGTRVYHKVHQAFRSVLLLMNLPFNYELITLV